MINVLGLLKLAYAPFKKWLFLIGDVEEMSDRTSKIQLSMKVDNFCHFM